MTARDRLLRAIIPGLALVLLILAANLPALRGDFLWDDDSHVSANPVIIGPQGLKEIWTTAAANYFPLVLTNFWVQHALWGLAPLGYHLTTLLFHALGAILLWRVLLQLGVPAAWFAAACWAVHPVQVESVAWICELKNTQSGVFYLLAIGFYLRWLAASDRGARARGWYALTFFCAVCAVLSKPSTVMLPVAFGLCAWWQRGRFAPRDLVPLVPFLVLSAMVSGWTIWEQKYNSDALGPEWNQTFPERIAIAGRSTWFYLGKLVWPHPLKFIYPRWSIDATQWPAFLAPLAVLATLAVMFWQRARWRGWLFAGLYFGALLFPVLGFFNVYFFRFSFVGDHFQYLASMGPIALLAAGVRLFAGRARHAIVALVLFSFVALSFQQGRMYRDPETFYRTIIAQNPGAWMAHSNLGKLMHQKGDVAAALANYETALRLNPESAEVHNNLGGLLLKQPGRSREAINHLEAAIRIEPRRADAYVNLGLALAMNPGSEADALVYLRKALELNPRSASVHGNLAHVLANMRGHQEEAVAHYETALGLDDRLPELHNDFASLLAKMPGRAVDAIRHYERALQLQPDYAEAHNNLANELAKLPGRMPDAIAHYERALRLNPQFAAAHYNLANKLAQMPGRSLDAIRHYEDALQADPNFALAYFALGNEYAQLPTRQQDAIALLLAAVQLDPKSIRARQALADVLARNGYVDDAVRVLESILADQPANDTARQALAALKSARKP